MFKCHVCGSNESHESLVSEVFEVDGKQVLMEDIPAVVCQRCGEETFSRETTEQVRSMVHGAKEPVRTVTMEVFRYALAS